MAKAGAQSLLRDPLRILTVVAGLVLLIGCANVTNLLLARSVSRHKEFGIRIAIGAGRWRLARQLVVETLLVAGMGAALGVLMAQWIAGSLINLLPATDLPIKAAFDEIAPLSSNANVLLFTIAVSLLISNLSSGVL